MTTSSFIAHAARDRTALGTRSHRIAWGKCAPLAKNPYLPSWNDTPLAVFE
jgi:hypothetical protein